MHYLFKLPKNISEDEAISLLLEQSFSDPYIIEEAGQTLIGAFHETEAIPPFELLKKEPKPNINWEEEWAEHAPYFENGVQSLTLPNGKILELLPGAGFGDYSHPTTKLCLEKMAEHLKDQTVIDLGSGSGILMLASRLLGAPLAIGIEIDPEAVAHSIANQERNHIDNIYFDLEKAEDPLLIVINMIRSEQMALFQARPEILSLKGTWIVSGLLQEERDLYLSFAKGAILIDEEILEGWLVLVLHRH